MPAPALVKLPVPDITPEKVVLFAPPAVNAPAPSITLPAPEKSPTVWVWPLRSNTPPRLTVRAPVGARLPPGPSCSVPALMMVPPV